MKRYFPKFARIGIWVLLAVVITELSFYYYRSISIKRIENEISNMISGEVFTSVEYTDFKETLISYSKKKISKASLGTVYNRLSLLCQQEGDWLGYYSNFGKAAYYLEESGNFNDELNLYCDLIYYVFFAHGNFDLAQVTMAKIDNLVQKNSELSNMMEALINQRHALLAYYLEDYDTAVIEANRCKETVQDTQTVYSQSFYDAAEILIAKTDIENDDYSLAKEIIKNQKESPAFTYGDKISMINTNFIIPYYQLLAYVSAREGNLEQLRFCISEITSRASEFDFEYAVYDTLKILRKHNTFPSEFNTWISEKELSTYKHFINEKSGFYTAICNALIDTNYQETRTYENERISNMRQGHLIIALILFLILLGIFSFILRNRLYTDALTGVKNRRAFDKAIKKNNRSHTDYAVIMIDIDDFKKVNDMFGHEEGDYVLRKVGEILLDREEHRKIVPYRYGGEEFSILVYENNIQKGKEIAESLRYQVECQKWKKEGKLTISAGFAPTVDLADKNLYIAKNNGKNQVI